MIDWTTHEVKAGKAPTVKVYVPLLSYFDPPGTTLGMTYRVFEGKTQVAVGQPTAPLGFDQSVSFIAQFKPVRGHTYKVSVAVNDPNGQTQTRTATLVAA